MRDYYLLNHVLIVAAVLFALGLFGVVARRFSVRSLLSIGIAIQSVVLVMTGFSRFHSHGDGQAFSLMIIGVGTLWSVLALFVFVGFAKQRTPTTSSQSTNGMQDIANGHQHVAEQADERTEAE